VILTDTNILLRSLQTSVARYSVVDNALDQLRQKREVLCVAPQNLVEFWSVATRPLGENGLGMTPSRAAMEITAIVRLFHLLPYTTEVLETWRRIVLTHAVSGKQTHDAHLVAIMQVHSVASILTFNGGHFTRFRGIQVIDPSQFVVQSL
jgi:predicted nucleic acid-binding protein